MIYTSSDVDLDHEFRFIDVVKRRRGNPGSRQKFQYLSAICAFDIETSRHKVGRHNAGTDKHPHWVDDYVSMMYIWQFQLGPDCTVYGRTWEDFGAFMVDLVSHIADGQRLVIFVHNLAYEFQYLRDPAILGRYIDDESVFLIRPRTPVRFQCFDGKIEFRCSYIHSNMSLDEYTDKMKVQHRKLSGDEFDYDEIRYPWTPLTDRQLEYCYNDVIGLVEAIITEMLSDGDDLYSFPLTATGYVRKDMKKAKQPPNLPYGYIEKQLPDYPTYQLLRQAFRGGNTHANRYWTDKRCDDPVTCRDFSSSYPNVLINCKYPVTPFREIDRKSLTLDHMMELMNKGRALVMQVAFYDLHLRDPFWPVPYLSRDKCREIYNAEYDNGRILRAEYLETTITDIDLRIIADEYEITEHDVVIIDARFASYGYLPDVIRDVIRDYYNRKTALKGDDAQKIQYDKAKAKLNSCYGMMAQNPVKLNDVYKDYQFLTGIKYKDDAGKTKFLTEEDAEKNDFDIYELAHRENIDKSTLPYQWGVWCTCWARERLERAIKICHDQNTFGDFLYCDTDSVYYYGTKDFEQLNADAIHDSTMNKAYAEDIKGVRHYMGVMEIDKTCASFKTLGAKKYAYIDNAGKLHITIAGVSKSKGAAELEAAAAKQNKRRIKAGKKPIDGLTCLQEDFVFRDAGGTESQYNDDPIPEFKIDGHTVYLPSNVVIVPSTYKVSIAPSYTELLETLERLGLMDLYAKNFAGAQLPSIEI